MHPLQAAHVHSHSDQALVRHLNTHVLEQWKRTPPPPCNQQQQESAKQLGAAVVSSVLAIFKLSLKVFFVRHTFD